LLWLVFSCATFLKIIMKIKLAVFDLAGTTVKDNKDVHRVLQSALAKNGVHVSIEDANRVMGIPKPVAIKQLLVERYTGNRVIDGAWVEQIHRAFVDEMIRFYKEDNSVGEKAGVSETFRILKSIGIKVAVDTGFDRPITAPLLNRLGWIDQGLIDASVTSDEVSNGRPFPDMIFEAMRRTGISDAKTVAKIGDTASDLDEGNSAGCGLVIGVTTGAFSREELTTVKHSFLIDNLDEVVYIIKNHS
jgi:phosphonatase-like hydrolase